MAAPILTAQPTDNALPAQIPAAPASRPVLVLDSQHRLPEEFWAALFAALHSNLPEVEGLVPVADANPEFVRGSRSAAGTVVGEPVTVYLLGDCVPPATKMPFPWATRLGWVTKVDGQIVPIIHVECTPIGAAISGGTEWMNRNRRTAAMSEAIAQVILHEWVHVATESGAHASEGVAKARFSVDDLLCGNQARNCGGQQIPGKLER